MPVYKTANNKVVADEPEADDLFVQVVWHGPHEDGRHMVGFEGPIEPIAEYQRTIEWAVSMAEYMRFPLYVVPLRIQDALKTERMKRAVERLTDQERGELRRMIVARLAEVMRDCDDPDLRADAYDQLLELKVIRL
ncbi:hypothetical protein [Sphingomonas glaciei]|uniref:Uncharacterized protein n=1 Tax=Sphingomonas glaciei TaxID=2938948 RepID=A0ABY5N0W6_9SPHN|nr:hypothetical protein [Sphingomonas glaciei]UUR08236.1 hypothetical protein M1K48_00895 [Sphingomonas glaciei]